MGRPGQSARPFFLTNERHFTKMSGTRGLETGILDALAEDQMPLLTIGS
jgi:hypothetical protein